MSQSTGQRLADKKGAFRPETAANAETEGARTGSPWALKKQHSGEREAKEDYGGNSCNSKPTRSFHDDRTGKYLTRLALRALDRRATGVINPCPSSNFVEQKYSTSNLQEFAKNGGPALEDLRGYNAPLHTVRSGTTSTSESEESDMACSRYTSVYNSEFELNLRDHGISKQACGSDPDNLDEIVGRLALPRSSQFTQDMLDNFRKVNDATNSKAAVMVNVLNILVETPEIVSGYSLKFGKLLDLTDGALDEARPDMCDGAALHELNRQTREQLKDYIVPSDYARDPCLPNFFLEVAGPDISTVGANRHILYASAIGARGVHQFRQYLGNNTALDNKACTISAVYYSEEALLALYAVRPVVSKHPQRPYDFHMTPLGRWLLSDSIDTFRTAVSALQNARDWAKEIRDGLIQEADEKEDAKDKAATNDTAAT